MEDPSSAFRNPPLLEPVMLGHDAFHFLFGRHGVTIPGLVLISEPPIETHGFINQDDFGDILSLMGLYMPIVLAQHADHIEKGGGLPFDFFLEGLPFARVNGLGFRIS